MKRRDFFRGLAAVAGVAAVAPAMVAGGMPAVAATDAVIGAANVDTIVAGALVSADGLLRIDFANGTMVFKARSSLQDPMFASV